MTADPWLASYAERFFQNPDGFINSLLHGMVDEKTWQSASEMRDSVRDILFYLNEKQGTAVGSLLL